jgi:hypothetical protein
MENSIPSSFVASDNGCCVYRTLASSFPLLFVLLIIFFVVGCIHSESSDRNLGVHDKDDDDDDNEREEEEEKRRKAVNIFKPNRRVMTSKDISPIEVQRNNTCKEKRKEWRVRMNI